jgi:hypothetical protein
MDEENKNMTDLGTVTINPNEEEANVDKAFKEAVLEEDSKEDEEAVLEAGSDEFSKTPAGERLSEEFQNIFLGKEKGKVEVPLKYVKPEEKVEAEKKAKEQIKTETFYKDLETEDLTELQKLGIDDPPLVQGEFARMTDQTNLMAPKPEEFMIKGDVHSIVKEDGSMLKYTNIMTNENGELVYTSGRDDKKAGLDVTVPVKIQGSDSITLQTLTIDVEGMLVDDAHALAKEVYKGYQSRAKFNYPTPNFQSSEEHPLPIENAGTDIRVGRTPINSVIGFKDPIYHEYLKRSMRDIAGPVWDVLADTVVGEVFPFIYETAATTIKNIGFNASMRKQGYRTAEDYKKLKDAIERIHTNSQEFSDAIPSSMHLLEYILVNKPSLEDFNMGFAALREEDIGNFIDGKNEAFLAKYFKNVATASLFLKTIDKMLSVGGMGPDGAKQLVSMLKGEKNISGKFARVLKKSNQKFLSGFDFWKSSQSASFLKGKSDDELKKLWFAVPDSQKIKYTNQSFSDLFTKLYNGGSFQGAFSFGKFRRNMLNNRKKMGDNLPAYFKTQNMEAFTEGLVVTGVAALTDNPIYMLPAVIAGQFGANRVYNTKFWLRAKRGKDVGRRVARVVGSAGEGFASFADALLYAVSGKYGTEDILYSGALQRVRTLHPGQSDQWYEDYLHLNEGFSPRNFTGELQPFYIPKMVGGVETQVLVQKGDKEYESLQELVDNINEIDDIAIKNNAIEAIGGFIEVQNRIANLATRTGKEEAAQKLSTALYEVIDLFTTSSIVKNMVDKPDFKFLSPYDLQAAESIYQNRKIRVGAINDLLGDFIQQTTAGAVGDELSDIVRDIRKAVDSEEEGLVAFKEGLDEAQSAFDATYTIGSFQSDANSLLLRKHEHKNNIFSKRLVDLLKKGQVTDEILKESHKIRRENLLSLEQELKVNHTLLKTDGEKIKGKKRVIEAIEDMTDHEVRTKANLIYGNLYEAADKISVNNNSMENLILQFDDSINLDAADRIAGKQLTNRIKYSSLEIFETALQKEGDQLRNSLMEELGVEDIQDLPGILRQLGVDKSDIRNVNSNFLLYKFYLQQRAAKLANKPIKAPFFLEAAEDAFANTKFNAAHIVDIDKAINGRLRELNRVPVNSRSETQKGEMQALIELGKEVKNTLMSIPELGSLYENTAKMYRLHAGTKGYTYGRHPVRTNVVESDDINLMDDIENKVYNKDTMDAAFAMGKNIVEHGGDVAADYLLRRHGTLGRTDNANDIVILADGEEVGNAKYILANADEAFMANIKVKIAIDHYIDTKMKEFRKNYPNLEDMDKLPDEVADFLVNIQSGSLRANMINFEKRFVIPDNIKVWNGKSFDMNTGEPVYVDSKEYLLDTEGKIISRTKDQVGKNQVNYYNTSMKLEPSLDLVVSQNIEMSKKFNEAKEIMDRMDGVIKRSITNSVNSKKNTHKKLVEFLQGLNVPLDKSAAAPRAIAEALIKDGTGETATKLIALIANDDKILNAYRRVDFLAEKYEKKRVLITAADRGPKEKTALQMSKEEKLGKARDIVKQLILYKFADDVLEISGLARPILDIKTGKFQGLRAHRDIDLEKLKNAEREYGNILDSLIPEEKQMIDDIANYTSFDFIKRQQDAVGGTQIAGGVLNIPRKIPFISIIARVFAVARKIISPKFVGAEAMVRTARLMKAEHVKAVLTSQIRVKLKGDEGAGKTGLEVMHDMLINGQYTVKNMQRMEKLLPLIIHEAELEIGFFDTDQDIPFISDPIGDADVNIKIPYPKRGEPNVYESKRPEGEPIIQADPDQLDPKYKNELQELGINF